MCYKTGIDVLTLVYGNEDMLPTIERVDVVLPKESLEFTNRSRTPVLPSQSKETYLYYLYMAEEKEEEKSGTGPRQDVVELVTLKRLKEGTPPNVYYIKQLRIDGKVIESRIIVCDVTPKLHRFGLN